MTPAVSVSFFKTEYQEFLYSPLCAGNAEKPLSVLSALARLGLDPWDEAARLSELPTAAARDRLAALLARLPVGCWAHGDSTLVVGRLVQLLPPRGAHKLPLPRSSGSPQATPAPAIARLLILAALAALAFVVVATIQDFSSRGGEEDSPPSAAPFTRGAAPN